MRPVGTAGCARLLLACCCASLVLGHADGPEEAPHHHPHYCTACAQKASAVLAGSAAPNLVEPFPLSAARLLPGSAEWTAQQTNLEYLVSCCN